MDLNWRPSELQRLVLCGLRCGYCRAATKTSSSGDKQVCLTCNAWVGIGKDGKPFGRVAKQELRYKRQAAHRAFDPVWRLGYKSRNDAYEWLAGELNIPRAYCHMGMFGEDTCDRVVTICKDYLAELEARAPA